LLLVTYSAYNFKIFLFKPNISFVLIRSITRLRLFIFYFHYSPQLPLALVRGFFMSVSDGGHFQKKTAASNKTSNRKQKGTTYEKFILTKRI